MLYSLSSVRLLVLQVQSCSICVDFQWYLLQTYSRAVLVHARHRLAKQLAVLPFHTPGPLPCPENVRTIPRETFTRPSAPCVLDMMCSRLF
ncbi:hypothetical protein BJV78DRAFT_1246246, partial [Lactifluus subvellereus]